MRQSRLRQHLLRRPSIRLLHMHPAHRRLPPIRPASTHTHRQPLSSTRIRRPMHIPVQIHMLPLPQLPLPRLLLPIPCTTTLLLQRSFRDKMLRLAMVATLFPLRRRHTPQPCPRTVSRQARLSIPPPLWRRPILTHRLPLLYLRMRRLYPRCHR